MSDLFLKAYREMGGLHKEKMNKLIQVWKQQGKIDKSILAYIEDRLNPPSTRHPGGYGGGGQGMNRFGAHQHVAPNMQHMRQQPMQGMYGQQHQHHHQQQLGGGLGQNASHFQGGNAMGGGHYGGGVGGPGLPGSSYQAPGGQQMHHHQGGGMMHQGNMGSNQHQAGKHLPGKGQMPPIVIDQKLMDMLYQKTVEAQSAQKQQRSTGSLSHSHMQASKSQQEMGNRGGKEEQQVMSIPSSILSKDESENGDEMKDDADNKDAKKATSAANDGAEKEVKAVPVGFSKAYLGGNLSIVLHENVIASLYFDQTHQCMQTGKRFREKEQLQNHLDLLYQRKKLMRETTISRKWFVMLDQWKQSFSSSINKEEEADEVEKAVEAKNPKEHVLLTDPSQLKLSVIADPKIKVCPLSHEDFKVYYNEDDQQWHFKDAVRLCRSYQGHPAGTIVMIRSLPPEVRTTVAELSQELLDEVGEGEKDAKRRKLA